MKKEDFFRKGLVFAIILLFVGSCVVPSIGTNVEMRASVLTSRDNILYVGGSGPGNYTTIQSAISDANNGDTVFVYDDSSPYYENVIVNKSINLTGENKDTTVIYGDWEAVYISADWVNLSEFTIRSSEEDYCSGIKLDSCNNNILDNILTDSWCGIYLSDSSNYNTITRNILIGLGIYGICLSDSDNGNIINNNTFSSIWYALYLSYSSNNIITDNYFEDNDHGIIIENNCMNNTIAGNTLTYLTCCTCIGLFSSNCNIIIDNTITMYSDWGDGIHFYNSKNNIVIGNSISDCGNGIVLRDRSSYNMILCNNIINCAGYGIESCGNPPLSNKESVIHLSYSRYSNIKDKNIQNNCYGNQRFLSSGDNSIHHNNFINNAQNAYDKYSNEWDNGYPSGGNYWDDYSGTDADSDGIGDTPYNISGGDNQDRYPLMEPWGDNLIPIAKFTWTPILPDPNETVLFNASESIDYDGYISLYEWDWNNDGMFDESSTTPIASHTFGEMGYYTVNLLVHDNESAIDTITKTFRVGNNPPNMPSDPHPPDGSTNVSIACGLSWTGGDPDGDLVTYDVYFGTTSSPSKIVSNNTHTFFDLVTLDFNTTYYWKVIAWDYYRASTSGPIWTFTTRENQPPDTPIITGQIHGKVGVEYQYTFLLSDPDDDSMYLRVDWGNGTPSPWQGTYDSDTTVTLSHIWNQEGTCTIRAQTKDIYGAESDWGTLLVTMPVNQQSSQQSSSMPSIQNVISVVPSTGTAVMEKASLPASHDKSFDIIRSFPAYTRITNAVDSPKKLSVRGHVAYGWVVYSSLYMFGPCYFDVTKPGTITKLADILIPNFLSGGTWTNDGRWLCCYYGDGQLWEVNPLNGNIYVIGGGGVNLNGLAYNPINNKMYGAGDTALYLIDQYTGAQTYVANFSGNGGNIIIGIAFDSNGVLYGWDVKFNGSSYLYTINTTTAQCTIVGSMGITLCYAQDGAFDYDTDTLYLSAFTISPNWGGYLYTCDKNSGACTLVGAFPGVTEIDALAIPYNWSGPNADFTWTPTLPEPGETIFFNASASFDPNGHIILYEWDWNNDGIFDENHTNPTATHSWSSSGFYHVTLKVTDNSSLIGMETKKVRVGNQPPDTPTIIGPVKGIPGVKYNYTIVTTDPEGDDVYYCIDLGDNTSWTWSGPYTSGEEITFCMSWHKKGIYIIRAKAKDVYGAESDWGYLKVTIPTNLQINKSSNQLVNKQFSNQLLLKMLQRVLQTLDS